MFYQGVDYKYESYGHARESINHIQKQFYTSKKIQWSKEP